MKNRFLRFIALLLIIATTRIQAQEKQPAWTIMIYAQADSILNNFAVQNFNAMASIGSNKNLNIVVQWNQPRKKGSWRYKIDKNKMTLVNTVEHNNKPNATQDLIDFARFTQKNYPAENYAFIFWSHGVGILDPEWNQLQHFAINKTIPSQSSKLKINTATKTFDIQRGILFDMTNRSYLNNQGLSYALSEITNNILHKKFSLIGMDACLMAMLEISYQIKNFADYYVSSEEVELAQGWNYAPFLHMLNQNNMETKDLAQHIVSTYEDFYKNKTQFYTQSAVNLTNIDYLKQNIDSVVSNIKMCKQINTCKMEQTIMKARKNSLQFSTSCYIDLHSFYSELYKQLLTIELESTQQNNTNITQQLYKIRRTLFQPQTTQALVQSQEFKNLKENLEAGIKIIDSTVIANVASNYLSRSKGISIYFPLYRIDPSYIKTKFAQESLWLQFLQDSCASL